MTGRWRFSDNANRINSAVGQADNNSEQQTVALCVPGIDTRLRLYVHGPQDLHVSAAIRTHGIWEAFETSLFLSLLRAGDVCLDVGANIGYYSVLAATKVGEDGAVFAFEPESNNVALLSANLALNQCRNVCWWPVALGATSHQRTT